MVEMEGLIKKADILIEALPYIQKLAGKTLVIKYGGHAMINEELRNSVMEDIILLKCVGANPILVHGGGPDISAALKQYQVESQFIDGLRVTDGETMAVAQMVLVGKTNKEIVSLLGSKGGRAIGLCGIDGRLILCSKKEHTYEGQNVDLGYVGDIISISNNVLTTLTNNDFIPVVAPVGTDKQGNSYNINADTVASAIACALKAEKLMMLTDTSGILDGEGQTIFELSRDEVMQHIEDGIISGGMIPKSLGCIEAIDKGVRRVHILDGRIPHSILLEIFTDTGIGTMIK